MSAVPRTRPVVGALALVLSAGCSSHAAGGPVDRTDLAASVAQFRPDEGPGRVTAGVTNNSRRTVHVTAATLRWAGLRFPAARLEGRAVPPGETAVFRTSYAAAGCGRRVTGRPVVLATVDGRRTRLRLEQDDPTLFARLHTATCARAMLDDVATVHVDASASLEPRGDGYVLPASIVLTRRPGSTSELSLLDLGGSVLLDLRAHAALPVVLRPGEERLRLPVTFGSTRRCDGHALGQSQQTFLLSVFVRLPGEPVQREVLRLDGHDLALLQSVIDRSCRRAGAG